MDNSHIFDTLFSRHYDELFFFARRYLQDEEDCHDVVSAVFESVWRNMNHLDMENIRHYLYAVVRSRCIDHLRRTAKHKAYVDYAAMMSAIATEPDRLDEQDERLAIVRRLLDEMGPPTNDILCACYVEGKKYREVAEDMKISISTVKKHIVKALKFIREYKKLQKP
ncbi:MAG: sigma-70 family RNA polymerase sigma factor [Bacteroidales bacterium]|nr:sigma-70 family RNA polymerase sigma factor [Bacteroidales bacterium]